MTPSQHGAAPTCPIPRSGAPGWLRAAALVAFAAMGLEAAAELGELSIEELMGIEVTSASRKAENLGDTASAIFVISAEDLRRSGATSIPEALRLVPGMHVARIDATKWAVSARGFNDRFANKLLVLMDGRHLYTPYFSGVFWDEQMVAMDDVERIEVIRGPGATLWGSNAVNGVINIITRSARDSQGWMVQASAGNASTAGFSARYGGVTQSGWHYRATAEVMEEDGTRVPLADDRADELKRQRVGFRVDGSPWAGHNFKLDASYYRGDSRETARLLDDSSGALALVDRTGDLDTDGGWLTFGWELDRGDRGNLAVTAYYDRSQRESLGYELDQTTFSLEAQSRHLIGRRHDLIWGLGWRSVDLPLTETSFNYREIDDDADFQHLEFFVQDEIRLADNLSFIVGSKFERTEYTNSEIQPNARLSWQPTDELSVWGAVSRAVRTPSRGERGVVASLSLILPPLSPVNPAPAPAITGAVGNDDVQSEDLTAYELGFRGRLAKQLDFDVALYYNDYEDLQGSENVLTLCEPGAVPVAADPSCVLSAAYLFTALPIDNSNTASSRGVEVALRWQPGSRWRLNGTVTRYKIDYDGDASDRLIGSGEPDYLATLQSIWNPRDNLEVDLTLRTVDDSDRYDLDGYTTLDARVGWRPQPALTVEVIGTNLIDENHQEFGSTVLDVYPGEIRRAVRARVTWAP